MLSSYLSIISALIVLLLCCSDCAEFPKEIQKCKYGDTDCIKSVATGILQKYPHGYAPLGVPDLEPFKFDEVKLNQGNNGAVSFNLTITDLHFYGLSNMTFTKFIGFEKDYTKSKYEIHGIVPKLINKSKYKISGKLLIFPVKGEGDAYYEIDNVRISMKSKPRAKKINGKSYLQIDKFKLLLDPENMKMNLTNLFNGDKLLSENMNKIMNENWKIMWDEFSPAMTRVTEEFSKKIINEMYKKFAYEDTFIDN